MPPDQPQTASTPAPQQPSSPPSPVKGPDEIFCASCGAVIKREAEICVHCGVRARGPQRSGGHRNAGVTGPGVGDLIALIAGATLVVSSLLPWYSADFDLGFGFGVVSASGNGWDDPGATWSQIAVFIGLAMTILALLRILGAQLLSQGGRGFVYIGATIAVAVCLGLKLDDLSEFLELPESLAYGFWIAVASTIALGVAGIIGLIQGAFAPRQPAT